jgi:betaine-homocysteine S-methyltransferase
MARDGILQRLSQGVVLGDGGYLLELERRGYVQSGPYTPEVSVRHPDALRQLHVEFLRAGAEVLQALTFYASRDKLGTAGHADEVESINRAAVRIAREVAGENTLVAGTLSLTWQFDPDNPSSAAHVRQLFDEQVALQAEEGVDFFICETFHYVAEALLALKAVQQVGLPAMVTMTFKEKEETRDGHAPEECARILSGEGADIVGANCARDPKHILPIVEKMRRAVSGYIAAQPIAYRTTDEIPYFNGLPEFPLELDSFQMTRREMAAYALQARDIGINFIGACCGTAAHHIRAMAEALERKPPASETTPDLSKHPILGTNAPRAW